MDELEFRRQLYIDPRQRDDELQQHAASTNADNKFYNEMQQFEDQLEQALHVDVPEGMADRIILKQSFDKGQNQERKRSRIHLALAASIAFAVGLSVNWTGWKSEITPTMGSVALEHVYHEMPYLSGVNEHPNLQTVNAKLARYGVNFEQLPGEVMYVNHCSYYDQPSFHMVMKGQMGSHVNVFVVPSSSALKLESEFSDKLMHGQVIQLPNASLVIVGELNEPLQQSVGKIKQQMNQLL